MTILQHPQQAPESYSIIRNQKFSGVADHMKRCSLKAEIRSLKGVLNEVMAVEPDNQTLLKNAIDDLPNLENEITKRLGAHLHEHRRSKYPLSGRYNFLMERIGASWLTKEIIKKAVEQLPEPADSMPIDKKQKEVARLKKMIEKKKLELEAASPPEQFIWKNGAPAKDLYEDFEYHWRNVQSRLNSPCNIRGITLDGCDEAERRAWHDMGIRSAMNPQSNMAPYIPLE